MIRRRKNLRVIPKRLIRIWFEDGPSIPPLFEEWWERFAELHPDYELMTITSLKQVEVYDYLRPILDQITTYAGWSDVARLLALYQYGGIYVDADVRPLRSFECLRNTHKVFIGRRSGASFESAVIGAPQYHYLIKKTLEALPNWFSQHRDRAASVQTGPAFVSSVLWGQEDVISLPPRTFYPYNGFGAPKRHQKEVVFAKPDEYFPDEMICAHFSNHKWGPNPNKPK